MTEVKSFKTLGEVGGERTYTHDWLYVFVLLIHMNVND